MQEFGDSVNRTFQYAVRVGIHSEGRRNHAYYPDRLDRLNDALGDSMNRMIVCVFMFLSAPPVPAMAAMSLTSNDIQPGTFISRAQIYPRCGGGNISPQLSWSGVPTGTKSFVLTMIGTSVKPDRGGPAAGRDIARARSQEIAGRRQSDSEQFRRHVL